MKDLGKIIARNRKAHKMKQGDLAKELESYDIYVKQNSISAWESGISQPSAKQLLAICEILNIYDVYTEFIGKNPMNPLRNLNEEGISKVMDYIQLLEKAGDYRLAEIIPLNVVRERKVFAKGLEPNIDAAFDHQIGNFSPYYIPSTRYLHYVPMKDIVCQIIACGGVPILAHPYGYCMNEAEIEQLVVDFNVAAMGHDFDSVNLSSDKLFTAGMEVYYQRYLDEPDTQRFEFLRKLQEKYGLLASAGSDRHRPYQPFCSGGDYCLFEKMVQSLHGEKVWR